MCIRDRWCLIWKPKRYVRSLTVPPGSVPAVALTIHGRRTAKDVYKRQPHTDILPVFLYILQIPVCKIAEFFSFLGIVLVCTDMYIGTDVYKRQNLF